VQSERLVEAVSACTRALAAVPDADTRLGNSDAATLGGLRADGDRLAVRHRFHEPVIQERWRPADPLASAVFESLEQARLDALGAHWLPGIARNLLAHPGAGEDGLRWLAFETFSGSRAPDVKAASVSRVRTALPAATLDELRTFDRHLGDHERFAAAAADWSTRNAVHVPRDTAGHDSAKRVVLPARRIYRELPSRGDPGRTRAPLAERTAQSNAGSEQAAGSGHVDRSSGPDDGYRRFTTAHDRVINASALANREELARLRATLEADLASLRTVVSRLAKRLMRVLMSQQARHWQFDLEEGLLDSSRLAQVVARGGNARPFKQEMDSSFPSTVVTLLIDHSGSMRGRPMKIAALTVEIFVRVLERCGIRCEVLGFTTRDWDGGEPAREWAARGYPDSPGRLNALEHIIVKSADVPWRRARVGLGLFLRDEMLKENIDGEAVAWAHARLQARSERRRILVVISDGTPMDEATLAANGHEYLDRHLASVVDDIETRSPVQLAAIGIGHDVSRFYRNATRIRRIDDLGPALTAKLMALLGEDGVRS
jgi:cobaltochelatase CobT